MGCAGSKTSPDMDQSTHPNYPTTPLDSEHHHQERTRTFRGRRLSMSQLEDERRLRRLSIHGYPSGARPPTPQCPVCTGAMLTVSGLKPVPRGTVAKVNQDRGLVVHPFCGLMSMLLFGVYDGHGRRGRKVSEFVARALPSTVQQLRAAGEQDLGDVLEDSYMFVDAALRHSVDASVSGTTAITCILNQNDLFIANAGDSRAIVCRSREGPSAFELDALDLTIDHKPNSRQEMERILRMGGSISPPGPNGRPARVWHGKRGLAMSRSIGDHAAAAVGVIARPEITEYAQWQAIREPTLPCERASTPLLACAGTVCAMTIRPLWSLQMVCGICCPAKTWRTSLLAVFKRMSRRFATPLSMRQPS